MLHNYCGEGKRQPTPVLLPGKSHGRRSLVGCSSWGREELDMTERLHFHLSLSCIGEGNGNPLQCSSLENPRDRGTWWAAIYRVAQSWTQLKRLSSSSHNYWTCLLEPRSYNYWSLRPRAHALQEKPQWEACALKWRAPPRALQLEKACTKQRSPSTARNK